MRSKKLILSVCGLLALIIPWHISHAQSSWNVTTKNRFVADVISFVQSCNNNFADVKGKLIQNNINGSKEFESTKQFGKFKTRILQMPDSSYRLSAALKIIDDDDIDTVQELLEQLPGYKVSDSDDDTTIEVPEGADKVLMAKRANSAPVIYATLYNENDNYIVIVIRKKEK